MTLALGSAVALAMAGTASAGVLNVPSEYSTIHAALAEAEVGDTVRVAGGVYAGDANKNLDPEGRDVVFLAAGDTEPTVIDCEDSGRAFRFTTGETNATVVDGFTVRHGNSWYKDEQSGGAVLCLGSAPRFVDCSFEDCKGEMGGAVFANEASPSFERCVFRDNWAGVGGGLCLLRCASASASHCVFIDNRADAPGVYAEWAPVKLQWCTFLGGFSTDSSCAMTVWGSPSPEISNCTFAFNEALFGSPLVPVLACRGGADPLIRNVLFAFNEARTMRCVDSTPDVRFCVAFGNTTSDELCGEVVDSWHADPLLCSPASRDVSLCTDSCCLPGNNPWGALVGSHDAGCGPCSTPVESQTWGMIKALYR